MTTAVIWTLVLASIFTGCAGSASSSSAGGPSAGPSQQSATPSSAPSASSGPSGAAGNSYTTARFGIPLTVTVAADLPPTPTDDTPGLLSWTATVVDNNRVRFLSPAEVYPPDATQAIPPPGDFLAYVQGLADHGAVYSDVKATNVDGVAATLMTAQVASSLDGSLGCPTIGADQAEGCFGLQPEFALRIAVMEVGGKPLLAWARTNVDIPDKAFLAEFEAMLATVDFK